MRRYRNPYRPNFGLSASSWSRPDARQSNWRVSSRKGQFDLKNAAAAAVWNAVLSTQYDILPMKKLAISKVEWVMRLTRHAG
jgi:hypothetical protein